MLKQGTAFEIKEQKVEYETAPVSSSVQYDLMGKLATNVKLTRKTVCAILQGISIDKFELFKVNPEQFISETARLVKEQKAAATIAHLTYDLIDETYDSHIFTENQKIHDFSNAVTDLKKHVYDFAVTDSKIERKFIENLDISAEVEVYAKLPRGFTIPTPLGEGGYNPDWAIAFKEGSVKHILFVAETKGSMSSMQLKKIEEAKIACARKYFDRLEQEISGNNGEKVKFNMVATYSDLLEKAGCADNG